STRRWPPSAPGTSRAWPRGRWATPPAKWATWSAGTSPEFTRTRARVGDGLTSPVERTELLVVGSGLAGLATAIKASRHGEVTLLSRGHLIGSSTCSAQRGIAAAVGADDAPAERRVGTLRAGGGLVREDAAALLAEDGPQR